MNSDKDTD